MKRTCKHCRHWSTAVAVQGTNNALHRCESKKLTVPFDWQFLLGEPTDVLAYEYDGSGFFFTGPDYGCVHFKRHAAIEEREA